VEKKLSDHLIKRFTLLKKIEYFIEESVYYRTHHEAMHGQEKKILIKSDELSGKVSIK
jgi:hypothetical protein